MWLSLLIERIYLPFFEISLLIQNRGVACILRETITRFYVQRKGKPLWVVSEDMERDVFMSTTEAQAHGIVDVVAVE